MNVNIGKGITLAIDVDAIPANAMQHVVYIGLRNILMDAHAGITKETNPNDLVAASQAVSEKKLAALMAGEVRVSGSREGDPIKAEAIRMATAAIRSAWRKTGRKLSDLDPKTTRAKAETMLTPELLAMAKARVEQVKATEIDLTDLV